MKSKQIPTRKPKSLTGLKEFCEYVRKSFNNDEMILAEIGCWAGVSTQLFADYFRQVYAIDPWEKTKGTISADYDMQEVERLFDQNTKGLSVIKRKARSEDIAHEFPDDFFDLVYIDGEHTYEAVCRDIDNYIGKCKIAIAGHDYWPGRFDGVIKAVNEKLGLPDHVFDDTSWIKYICI